MAKNIVLTLFTLLVYQIHAEGARGSQANSLYAQLSWNPVATDRYFANDGEITKGPFFLKNAFLLYASYGLWNEDLSLAFSGGWRTQELENLGNRQGLEDASLRFDWRLFQKNDFALAPSFELGIPLGEYEAGHQLSLGDGEWNFKYKLFMALHSWDAEIYFNQRTDEQTDEYGFSLQYKHEPWQALWLTYGYRAQFTVQKSNPTLRTDYLAHGDGIQYGGFYTSAFYSFHQHFHGLLSLGTGAPSFINSNLYAWPYFGLGVAITL